MRIPIQNIYYLLCYAWDKLEERDVVAVEALDATTLVDLFARVLINGTSHLLRRGFDRGYVSQRESTGRLRGRICFQDAVRRNASASGKLPCEFDEMSYDVLHNRILKATMRQLIRVPDLADESSERLAQLSRLLSEIEEIEVTSGLFNRVQLHRNNQFYDFLLKVCELIHYNLLISETPGASKFMDFVQDKQQMAALFEEFIRYFYRQHVHSAYHVKREDIQWRWEAANQAAMGLLPKMQTDVSLTSATRKIIIECKFTPEGTQHHYEAETLRSSHLFQVHAYLSNLRAGDLTDLCEVVLLYPTVDKPLAADYVHNKHKIRIRTISLDQPWRAIHEDLLALVA